MKFGKGTAEREKRVLTEKSKRDHEQQPSNCSHASSSLRCLACSQKLIKFRMIVIIKSVITTILIVQAFGLFQGLLLQIPILGFVGEEGEGCEPEDDCEEFQPAREHESLRRSLRGNELTGARRSGKIWGRQVG
jgi:hypothetical protein